MKFIAIYLELYNNRKLREETCTFLGRDSEVYVKLPIFIGPACKLHALLYSPVPYNGTCRTVLKLTVVLTQPNFFFALPNFTGHCSISP